jgi:hypothetical protein
MAGEDTGDGTCVTAGGAVERLVDLLLTRLGVRYLIVETKRPGSFDGPASINRALGPRATPKS